MIVVRTSVRRRLIKAAVPFMVTAAAACAVVCAVPFIEQISFTGRHDTAEIVNMNGNDEPVLYSPENEQAYVTDETEADGTDKDTSIPYNFNEEDEHEEEVTEASAFTGKYLLTQNVSEETEDLSGFTLHSGAIYEETFGRGNGPEYIELGNNAQLRNCTGIGNDTVASECSEVRDISVELYSSEPQVLIMHTHTTESYEPYIKDWYDERYTSRSSDPGNSVIAVGEAISEQLAAVGISVIHDCTIHDNVYSGAYTRSLRTTLAIMEKYPSIKIVLDIHRDAIEFSDGTRVSAVTEIDGKKAAQVMVICAADDGTYDVPGFYNNLHFACRLQESMEGLYPTLTRPVLFQYCQYNQQVSPGALLIEVGSHGNSIDEAVYSGELIGKSLAALLTETGTASEAVPVMANMPIYFLDRLK